MKQKKQAEYAFYRFMHGIFQYYHDEGMPAETAKARMLKEVYETCFDLVKQEEGIPDHLLVIMMQHASRMLHHRGYVLSKRLSKEMNDLQRIEQLRQSLRQLKQVKDVIDQFIETYRGDYDDNRQQQRTSQND